MRNLSKSKILSSRQCAKKLWLEVHQKDLAVESEMSQKNFDIGNQIGELSREIYDPAREGQLIDPFVDGFEAAFQKTQALLTQGKPVFEAAFSIEGGLVLADVLLPAGQANTWRMVEIKSSTIVKDYHLDDVAIQHYVSKASGLRLDAISLGHIDNQWVYQGDNDYSGLITEVDLTEHAINTEREVKEWFESAQATAGLESEPKITIGPQCKTPFECPFFAYCSKDEPMAEYPVSWLPRIQKKALKEFIAENNIIEMADVPDELLNEKQLRVKTHTLADTVYFDQQSTNAILGKYEYPHYFLDFETINLAVPKWKGTRAYQQVPFQFSLHYFEHPSEDVIHKEFLDLSGDDPSLPFANALIELCGDDGSVFVYNIGFESSRIKELAARFPDLKQGLLAINERLVDLWPIAKEHYYNPSQQGSWSIKYVLPAISDQYDYDQLEGVKDGGMAMDAFAKAIHPDTSPEEKATTEKQLLSYCEMDTLAMVEIFHYLWVGPIEPSGTLLEMINNQTFSLEEIQTYFLEFANDRKEYRSDYEKSAMVAGRLFDHDEELCLSIVYRLQGLSEFLTNEILPAWAMPKEGSRAGIDQNILSAIGQCEMIESDDNIVFDVDYIVKTALSNGKFG